MKESNERPVLFPFGIKSFKSREMSFRVGLIMIKIWSRGSAGLGIAVLAVALLAGCASQETAQRSPTATPTHSVSPSTATSVVYSNTLYGFTFTLPLSWTGYTVVNDAWSGYDTTSNKTVQTGSLILIRNPKWTTAKKMQDIPIMVFTIGQWDSMMRQEFTVGAAPIPPSELGRNAQFVFALPARYNYAFPTGYQEVDQILQSKPLHAK